MVLVIHSIHSIRDFVPWPDANGSLTVPGAGSDDVVVALNTHMVDAGSLLRRSRLRCPWRVCFGQNSVSEEIYQDVGFVITPPEPSGIDAGSCACFRRFSGKSRSFVADARSSTAAPPDGIARRNIHGHLLRRKSSSNHIHRWNEIRIAAYDNKVIAQILISVIEHGNGNVHIRAFFFWSIKKAILIRQCASGMNQAFNGFIFITTTNDIYERQSFNGLRVGKLVLAFPSRGKRREISNLLNLIVRPQKFEQAFYI
jgi:hypothetical protein